jgi:AcrR family transcriptional regulator
MTSVRRYLNLKKLKLNLLYFAKNFYIYRGKMKTKIMLSQSLKKLMLTNNLDKITVTQVTKLCKINRQTFYYHFKDIYDLVYWTLGNEEKLIVGDNYNAKSTNEIINNLYYYIISNEETICGIYYSLRQDILERYLVEKIEKYLFILLKKHPDMIDIEEDVIFEVCSFYKYSIVGKVFEWIRNGLSRDFSTELEQMGFFLEKSMIDSVNTILIFKNKKKQAN